MDPNTSAGQALFLYTQRVLEILFIGIMLSCSLTTFLPMANRQRPGGGASAAATASMILHDDVQAGKLMGRQIDSIVVNMQRTFADTISSIIPDDQVRRMVVLLGLCILPSIAGLVSKDQFESSDIKSVESFFFMFGDSAAAIRRKRRRGGLLTTKTEEGWHKFSKVLAKIAIMGLSTAWINTALGFILPPQQQQQYNNSQGPRSMETWISLVSTMCLAILTRALQDMFPGSHVHVCVLVCFFV